MGNINLSFQARGMPLTLLIGRPGKNLLNENLPRVTITTGSIACI